MEARRIRNNQFKNDNYDTEVKCLNKSINKSKTNIHDPNCSRSKSGNKIKDNSLSPLVNKYIYQINISNINYKIYSLLIINHKI